MRLELTKLPRTSPLAHTYQPDELSWQDEDVQLCGPVQVQGRIIQANDEVQVTGHLQANVETFCDRCARAVPMALESVFDEVYVTLEDYQQSRAEDLQKDDLRVSVYDGVALDLAEIVREEILLAVPGQVLCRADCRGLCLHCGADLNTTPCRCAETETDPRWAALKNL